MKQVSTEKKMLSPEELLKPRYKVIADYPFSIHRVGAIIDEEKFINKEWVANYPHLFRKLQWWEGRKPEDMPQYVRRYMNNEVFKAVKHFDVGIAICRCEDGNARGYMRLTPATETEYNEYIKLKTNE